ncbi:MAG: helix-turn-helix transcriptional regulator [Kofleriaceae bacterium]|nr:helix-turn-helix transcriptional regulator [Myxococcales bacterium]MCB9562180.1 helix-turn-helix transcriptional regulator [Kofleriaceae bacterium]
MAAAAQADPLQPDRLAIASKVRDLRKARRWTQAELSKRLHLSQNRLSEIERGAGSFTAEQLLVILKLFNVPLSYFVPSAERDESAELQNALARLGALHLQERDDVLPSERLDEVNDVVREALVAGTPRLVSAIAPVLVRNVDQVNFRKLGARLAEVGLDNRVGWLVENTLEALRGGLDASLPRHWAQLYRRAVVVLEAFLESVPARSRKPTATDILDATIRTKKTLEEVRAAASPISHRWGIVTGLNPADFAAALKAARVAD